MGVGSYKQRGVCVLGAGALSGQGEERNASVKLRDLRDTGGEAHGTSQDGTCRRAFRGVPVVLVGPGDMASALPTS